MSDLSTSICKSALPAVRGRGFAIVRIVLGLLLLIAAGLKLTDPSMQPLQEAGLLASPMIATLVIGIEILLGLWLLAGKSFGLWLTTLAFFSVLLAASLYAGIRGQRSCGCFGVRISLSPWYAALLDAAALAALVCWRPQGAADPRPFSFSDLKRLSLVAAGASVLVAAMLGGVAWVGGGSVQDGLLRLRGEPIALEPALLDLGDAAPGSLVKRPVRITNHADHVVRIVGGKSDCSCVTTPDLPVALSPGGSANISVWFRVPRSSGPTTGQYFLYTDDMQFRIIANYSYQGDPREN